MTGSITLTSSMRSNLTSLRTIASQMSQTQERLSSDKKVNSAIDNASSYYQARSLTNRAADLNALLDSMGQGIQTIQAATTGLEKAGEFLEHAAVIAQEAYEAALIPEKAWFEAQVGENGAVVTSAQELKDAINAGKETICVYGKIDYFENETLSLKAGQKLVGTEYFTGYTGTQKFSEINFKGTQSTAISVGSNTLISDLSINFETSTTSTSHVIAASGSGKRVINNLNINHEALSSASGSIQGTIYADSRAKIEMHGTINITGKSRAVFGVDTGANIIIAEDAVVNCDVDTMSYGLAIIYRESQFDVYGKLNARANQGCLLGSGQYSGNSFNVYEGAEITVKHPTFNVRDQKDEETYNSVHFEPGAKITLKDNSGTGSFISQGYTLENKTTSDKNLTASILRESGDLTEVEDTTDWENFAKPAIGEPSDKVTLEKISEQYQKMMSAFDDLTADSSYQGVNLLNSGDLNVVFNEDRTHSYTVKGSDITTTGLGITTREWRTKDDVLDSINEIKSAMNTIRDEVARLGNSYSIIQTREKFTEAMTDILETGADNLVLADMNEESADYLSLQVRNNLAINALALASQSAQSVLKLF